MASLFRCRIETERYDALVGPSRQAVCVKSRCLDALCCRASSKGEGQIASHKLHADIGIGAAARPAPNQFRCEPAAASTAIIAPSSSDLHRLWPAVSPVINSPGHKLFTPIASSLAVPPACRL